MSLVLRLFLVLLLVGPAVVAQPPVPDAENPASDSLRFFYSIAKRNLLRSAEKMPAADYAWRPTPEVRSFGELLAHVADTQFLFCSAARDEPNPNGEGLGPGDLATTIESDLPDKAGLIAALERAFAFCDPAIEGVADARWGDPVKLLGNDRAAATPLLLTLVHLWEHYGNVVTYLRLKGIVPPSSERAAPPAEAETGDAPASEDAANEAEGQPPEAPFELESYELVVLRRPADAPDYPQERLEEIQRDHLAYLAKMGEAGHLVVAGPFADQPDPRDRGLALYRVGSLDEARRLAEGDPAVEAGRIEVEVMTWYTQKGALAFPLAKEGGQAGE